MVAGHEMLANLEQSFVRGVIRKTLLFGVVTAAATSWLVSTSFAADVLVGALVSTINLRAVTWVGRKMLESAGGKKGATFWTGLLLVKMFLLFGVIYALIVLAGLSAIGFITGFSLFLPAVLWQAAGQTPDDDTQHPDERA